MKERIFGALRKFKGYRTVVTNVVAALVGMGAAFGIIIPQDDWTAAIAGIFAVVNILLRFDTDTQVFTKE